MRKINILFALLFSSLLILNIFSPKEVKAVTVAEAFPAVVKVDPVKYGLSADNPLFATLNTKLQTVFDNKYPYVLTSYTSTYTIGTTPHIKTSVNLSYVANSSAVLYEKILYADRVDYGCKAITSDKSPSVDYCITTDKTASSSTTSSVTPLDYISNNTNCYARYGGGYSATTTYSFSNNYQLLDYANPNGLFQPDRATLLEIPSQFQWNDEGIRIDTPKDNEVMTGYLEDSSSKNVYFDITLYGKYNFTPGLIHFDKVDQMDILANMSMSIDGKNFPIATTFSGDNGVDVNSNTLLENAEPTFTWVEPPSDKTGVVKFKVVLRVFSRKFDYKDIKVTTSLNTSAFWLLASDTNKNISLIQDTLDVMNKGYVGPVPGSGTTSGASGDNTTAVTDPSTPSTVVQGDGEPVEPGADASIVDWVKYYFKYVFYLITLPFKAIADMISALTDFMTSTLDGLKNVFAFMATSFSFIPKVVQNALWSVVMISLISVVLSIIRR